MPGKQQHRYRFLNTTKGTTLAENAGIAGHYLARLKGLLFTNSIAAGSGLFITPCNSIHMIGMLYAIDAVFLDKSGKVVGICQSIKPMQVSSLYAKAVGCLELPVHTVQQSQTEVGDQVVRQETES